MACNGKNSSWFSDAVHVIQHLDVIGQHERLATEGPATHLAGLLPCHGSGREKSRCRFPLGQYGQSLANPKQFHGGTMCYPVDLGRSRSYESAEESPSLMWGHLIREIWVMLRSLIFQVWRQMASAFMHLHARFMLLIFNGWCGVDYGCYGLLWWSCHFSWLIGVCNPTALEVEERVEVQSQWPIFVPTVLHFAPILTSHFSS